MPFQFNIEGPETRKARELQQRLQELQAKRLEMDLDPNAMLEQKTRIAEAAAAQGFNPQASPAAQAVGQRVLGEAAGYQKIPGTEIQMPMGTPPAMVQSLFENAINNAQSLRMVADSEQDPIRKRLYSGAADAAEQGLKSKVKELSAADLAFESNASAALRYADELENTVKKYGTFELMSPEGSAKLNQIQYQMAIAYAKVADPSSVAREGEVIASKKYMIPLGLFTRNETALSAISNYRNDILNRSSEYSRISGRQINIPKPTDYSRQQVQQQGQQQAAQQAAIPLVRDPSGRFVPAR